MPGISSLCGDLPGSYSGKGSGPCTSSPARSGVVPYDREITIIWGSQAAIWPQHGQSSQRQPLTVRPLRAQVGRPTVNARTGRSCQ